MVRVSAFLQLLRMDDEIPEVTGKVDLLLVCDIGRPKANDAILQPVRSNCRNVRVVVVGEIEPDDICADVAVILDCRNSCFHVCLSPPCGKIPARDHIELSGVINRYSNINSFALIMDDNECHYCSSSWTAEWAMASSTRQPAESFSMRVERIMDFKVIPPSTSIQASR